MADSDFYIKYGQNVNNKPDYHESALASHSSSFILLQTFVEHVLILSHM